MPDPLTPSALSAIESRVKRGYIFDQPGDVVVAPEDDIRTLLAAIRDATLSAQRTPGVGRLDFGHERAQVLGLSSCPDDGKGNECELCAEQVDRLILAVRNEAVSAERARLLALTPEQVVEEAAKAMARHLTPGLTDEEWERGWFVGESRKREMREQVRAALPVLLAPEVARREQAERELEALRLAPTLPNTLRMALDAAEAEAKRLRGALERYRGMVSDDSIAITYQSVGQYRTALLNALAGGDK